ncbi:MAG: hypothetical protein ACK40L_09115, partial [Hydrogenophaga sp.]
MSGITAITGMAGIGLSLVLLMALAYRGVSVLILAPLMALLAVLFTPGAPLLASYTQVFMPALGGFVIAFFPLFLLGAVFGKLMEASGAAATIARGIVQKHGGRIGCASRVGAGTVFWLEVPALVAEEGAPTGAHTHSSRSG